MELKEILKAARERLHVENLTPMQHEMAEVKAPEVVLVAPTGSARLLHSLCLCSDGSMQEGPAPELLLS